MKVYSMVSVEGIRVTTVVENVENAQELLQKVFDVSGYCGFDPSKIEELPMEGILPKFGEIMISHTVRV